MVENHQQIIVLERKSSDFLKSKITHFNYRWLYTAYVWFLYGNDTRLREICVTKARVLAFLQVQITFFIKQVDVIISSIWTASIVVDLR